MKKFIVYLTLYKGTKLPPWYIGSSFEKNIINGYNGSVKSQKYKEIYKSEQKNNKHLFKTKILSYHTTRTQALEEELRLQKMHLVVKNDKYFNESYAQANGFFGMEISEEFKVHMVAKRRKTGNGDYHNGNNPFADEKIKELIVEKRKANGNWHGFDIQYKGTKYKSIKELCKVINYSEKKIRKYLTINNIKYLNDIIIDNILLLEDLEPKNKKWLNRNVIEKNGIKYLLYYKSDLPEGFTMIEEYKNLRKRK